MDIDTKITEAFKTLRKQGYFARKSFMCCSSCALYEIPEEKSESYVFYNRQDAKRLREDGTTYLSWAGDGANIVKVLTEAGLAVDWNGSDMQRIRCY